MWILCVSLQTSRMPRASQIDTVDVHYHLIKWAPGVWKAQALCTTHVWMVRTCEFDYLQACCFKSRRRSLFYYRFRTRFYLLTEKISVSWTLRRTLGTFSLLCRVRRMFKFNRVFCHETRAVTSHRFVMIDRVYIKLCTFRFALCGCFTLLWILESQLSPANKTKQPPYLEISSFFASKFHLVFHTRVFFNFYYSAQP